MRVIKADFIKAPDMSGDLISRKAALGSVNSWRAEYPLNRQEPLDDCENSIRELPAVEAIPVAWIENEIAELKVSGETSSYILAELIGAMMRKWRKEEHGTD